MCVNKYVNFYLYDYKKELESELGSCILQKRPRLQILLENAKKLLKEEILEPKTRDIIEPGCLLYLKITKKNSNDILLEQVVALGGTVPPESVAIVMSEDSMLGSFLLGKSSGVYNVFIKEQEFVVDVYRLHIDNRIFKRDDLNKEIHRLLKKKEYVGYWTDLINTYFKGEMRAELMRALSDDLDVEQVANVHYNIDQLKLLVEDLSKDLDISMYADPGFNIMQMKEIRRGVQENVSVHRYAHPKYEWNQMSLIREAMRDRLEYSALLDNRLNYHSMLAMVDCMRKDLDVGRYVSGKYNERQIKEILLGLEKGLDVMVYADASFDAKQMRELRLGLEADLNTASYAKYELNWSEMLDARTKLSLESE